MEFFKKYKRKERKKNKSEKNEFAFQFETLKIVDAAFTFTLSNY